MATRCGQLAAARSAARVPQRDLDRRIDGLGQFAVAQSVAWPWRRLYLRSEVVSRNSKTPMRTIGAAQQFAAASLPAIGGQMAFDSLRPREARPVSRIRCRLAQPFPFEGSKLRMAPPCMGWQFAADSLRLREARPESHSVTLIGGQMAWDSLRLRKAWPEPWRRLYL